VKTEETTTAATAMSKPEAPRPKRPSANKSAAKASRQKTSKAATPNKRKAKTKSISKKAARGNEEVRDGTKKSIVLKLLRRKQGATTAEIVKATKWQNHTIRGFISGNVTKKMGLAVESSKNDAGERTYRIAK
jgi:hypothetical protein